MLRQSILLLSVLVGGTSIITSATPIQAQTADGAGPQDIEATKHGFDAAKYQVVDTYEYPGFKI